MKKLISIILICTTLLCLVLPASAAEVRAPKLLFVDVPEDAYYYDAVRWAVNAGVTSGTDKTHFSPNAICTRAQVVTFIWRSFGSPKPKTTSNPFQDVKKSDYFYQAVLWCVENKITSGTGANRFSPGEYCTRGQVATFLFRSAVYMGNWSEEDIAENKAALMHWVQEVPRMRFEDVSFSVYYGQPVYALENWGLVTGVSDHPHLFKPNRVCTRAEALTMLYRYWNFNWS